VIVVIAPGAEFPVALAATMINSSAVTRW
jgi:hypothetical protein